MAATTTAPTLSAGQIGNTLRQQNKSKSKQEKRKCSDPLGKKTTKKNVLFSPYNISWPQVEPDIENTVIDSLLSKLKELPKLCSEVWRGKKAGDNSADDTEDDLIRRRIRAQLAIGHRQVCKHLERDELSLLLVWGKTEPSIIIRSLIPLAASRACPAFCLQSVAPKMMAATGLTSLVALGFKRGACLSMFCNLVSTLDCSDYNTGSHWCVSSVVIELFSEHVAKLESGLEDFRDFISMATKLAPPLPIPWASEERIDLNIQERGEEIGEENLQDDVSLVNTESLKSEHDTKKEPLKKKVIDWPLVSKECEKKILMQLTSLLEPFELVFKRHKQILRTEEWKRQRHIVRSHLVTDIAAILDGARSGKLSLIIMQHDTIGNQVLNSAAVCGVENGCPILCLSHLRQQLSLVLRNPLLKAVAFRKCEEDTESAEFTKFTNFASQFAWEDLKSLLPSKQHAPHIVKDPEQKVEETGTKRTKPRQTKCGIPVYDISHLYVYKADKPRQVFADTKVQVSSDFISLESVSLSGDLGEISSEIGKSIVFKEETNGDISSSSKSAVQPQTTNSAANVTRSDLIYVDSCGNQQKTERKKSLSKCYIPEKSSPACVEGILGLDAVDKSDEAMAQTDTSAKHEKKSAMKRKLERGTSDQEFLSFKYHPVCIQTTISNPNKKKKRKK